MDGSEIRRAATMQEILNMLTNATGQDFGEVPPHESSNCIYIVTGRVGIFTGDFSEEFESMDELVSFCIALLKAGKKAF